MENTVQRRGWIFDPVDCYHFAYLYLKDFVDGIGVWLKEAAAHWEEQGTWLRDHPQATYDEAEQHWGELWR